MSKPIALVTGARQGLGRAIALSLGQAGFDIAALDLVQDEKAETLLADLKALGVRAYFGQLDIADIDAHGAAIDAAEAALGPVDVLVNNAGIAARPLTDVLDLGADAFDRNLDINLRGTFFLSQDMSRRMLSRDGAHPRALIFISSIAAEFAATDRAQYCISKAGLSMVVKLFADRLGGDGIAVHEIRPGFIRTEMTGSAPTDLIDGYIASGRVAQKRWGQATDIGAVITSLASGALPYVTGQPIHVDGGFHIPTV